MDSAANLNTVCQTAPSSPLISPESPFTRKSNPGYRGAIESKNPDFAGTSSVRVRLSQRVCSPVAIKAFIRASFLPYVFPIERGPATIDQSAFRELIAR